MVYMLFHGALLIAKVSFGHFQDCGFHKVAVDTEANRTAPPRSTHVLAG